MTNPLLNHSTVGNADQQLEEARLASIAADLRTVEVMLLDLKSIFDQCPEVMRLSFDIEGDANNMPMFSCVSPEDNDLALNPELVETIAERWNANTLPTIARFLRAVEGQMFARDSFWSDVVRACETMQVRNLLSLSDEQAEQWRNSFVSHFKAQALEQALPVAKDARKPRM